LRRFLSDKRAWITGIRNGHSRSRATAPLVAWDAANEAVKLNPMVRWTAREVWAYLRRHDLPTNPLHERGFPSIGCQPCTRAVRPGEGARAGRWPGFAKTECGIHRAPTRLISIDTRTEEPTR
jgi:phosphoadenosine phosphosulfate reductase